MWSSAKFGLTTLAITSYQQKEADAGMPFWQTFLDSVEYIELLAKGEAASKVKRQELVSLTSC